MVFALFSLVGKNLKMFFRSKLSATAVMLIPVLVIMLAGISFNSNEYSNIKIGVYSTGYTSFTEGIISDFNGEGFISKRYNTELECIDSVKKSDSQICVVFPGNLNAETTDEEIVFHADYSRVNLVGELTQKIQKSVLTNTEEIGVDLAQNLISSLESIKESLPQTKEKIEEIAGDTKEVNDELSDITFSTSDLENAIEDLEDAKSDINSSQTSLISDIESIIENLQEEVNKSIEQEETLKESEDTREKIASNINTVIVDLEKIITQLNSQKMTTANQIVSPIKTTIKPIDEESTSKSSIIPIAISLIILFGSMLFASTLVLKEKKTKAFFRNFMAPISGATFLFSTYITCLIILLLQFVLIFIGSRYILNLDVISMIAPLSIIIFASVSAFISLGMFIGYLFKSEESVIFSSIIISTLIVFFSNIILPIENTSGNISLLLRFSPLVATDLALKKVILFHMGIGSIIQEIIILLIFFAAFMLNSVTFRELTKRSI